MKPLFYLSFVGLFFLTHSCKRKPVVESGNVNLVFNNTAGGAAIEADKILYTNAAGNKYSISLLKYYVTNCVLVDANGTEFKAGNYDLIDAFKMSQFGNAKLSDVPNGNYKMLRFYLGIDRQRNHNGAQDGDLDPIHGMIWTWNTGYLFMKHEGLFITNAGDTTGMEYHFGTDTALTVIELPISLEVSGNDKTVNINFDLNKMYSAPIINFNSAAVRHSTDINDGPWIVDMRTNAKKAFTITGVQ